MKEDVIAESGAKKNAGGSAGSAVTPRKMDIPSFLRPIFGATSSSTYLVSILFFCGAGVS